MHPCVGLKIESVAVARYQEEMHECHQTLGRWRGMRSTPAADKEELEMLKCDVLTQCDSIDSQVGRGAGR
eukprot:2001642-Pyramimonas_sp.AAC.2